MKRNSRIQRYSKSIDLIRKNLDYGERQNYVQDNILDNYCANEESEEYWDELGDGEAAKDFQKYIREVKCDKTKGNK